MSASVFPADAVKNVSSAEATIMLPGEVISASPAGVVVRFMDESGDIQEAHFSPSSVEGELERISKGAGVAIFFSPEPSVVPRLRPRLDRIGRVWGDLRGDTISVVVDSAAGPHISPVRRENFRGAPEVGAEVVLYCSPRSMAAFYARRIS